MPGTGDPIVDAAVGYALWYIQHPVPGVSVADQLAAHREHGQNLTAAEQAQAMSIAEAAASATALAQSNENMTIAQAYANASGQIIPSDTIFGLRVFFAATLENGITLEMSVIVDVSGSETSAQISQRVKDLALAGQWQPKTGHRYKIAVISEPQIFSVVPGGAYGPTMML